VNFYNPENIDSKKWRIQNGFHENDVLFLYAGIIGIAQGLEIILQAANELKSKSNLKFLLLGSGPEKEKLQLLKKEMNLENVYFFDAVSKKEMPEIVASIDVSIVPLKKMDLFLGAIPSKIFENLAMEKPIILGVDGEARNLFIEQGNCGIYFEPENKEQLVNAISQLSENDELRRQLGKNGRNYVIEYFNRDAIATKFHEQLIRL
jgi:glycosyltransferase involved in cell wall biosynthesis